MYLSEGLDDWQVYDRDGLKEFNNNSSPRTTISSSFIYVSMLVYISNPY